MPLFPASLYFIGLGTAKNNDIVKEILDDHYCNYSCNYSWYDSSEEMFKIARHSGNESNIPESHRNMYHLWRAFQLLNEACKAQKNEFYPAVIPRKIAKEENVCGRSRNSGRAPSEAVLILPPNRTPTLAAREERRK